MCLIRTPLRRGFFIKRQAMYKHSRLKSYFSQRDRGRVLLLIGAVFLVYLPFLSNPLFFDDIPFFSSVGVNNYSEGSSIASLRWLPYSVLSGINATFDNFHTHFLHLGSVFLHIANAILLFGVLRKLTSLTLVQGEFASPEQITWGAWIGALVFAVHPVSVYAVGYVIQLSILMSTFFGLLMIWACLQAIETAKKRWLVVSVVSYLLACFSKEHAALMPLVVFAVLLLLRSKVSFNLKTLLLTAVGYMVVFILVVMAAKGVIGTAYEPMATQQFKQLNLSVSASMLHLLSVMTQTGLFFKYLMLWLLPNVGWMSIDLRVGFISSWSAWQGWLGMLAFTAYGLFAFRMLLCGGRKGLWGLAWLYPWLLFLIELTSVRIQEPFVLYRSYLWLPGLMLAFPLLLTRFKVQFNQVAGVALVSMVLLVPLSWNRLWVFADTYRLWNEAVKLMPNDQVIGADRVVYNRAQALALDKRWDEAAKDFERAIVISPDIPQIHKELGVAYSHLMRLPEAVAQFDIATSQNPDFAVAYYYKGLVLKMMHKNDLAKLNMKKSCELGHPYACVIVKYGELIKQKK